MRYKVIHLITGLNIGGAEMMLYRLLSMSNKELFDIKVISLTNDGPVGQKIKKLDIPILSLGMKRGIPNPLYLWKLKKILKKENPDILQTWMYHSDIMGYIAGKAAKIKNIVWGIHHSNLDKDLNKPLTIKMAQICAKLSKNVDKIISCSHSSFEVHKKIGYQSENMIIIPNGINIEFFSPNDMYKKDFKKKYRIKNNTYLIGHIGRWHPLKDHSTLIKAAKSVKNENSNVKFVLCGENITNENEILMKLINENDLEDFVILLGKRDDMDKIVPAFDLLVQSSIGEAFPISLGEAMSCEVPCVVTDVGDSRSIVGDTGFVVPPKSSELLSQAILNFLRFSADKKRRFGKRARNRIVEKFSLDSMVKKYESLYLGMLN